ncbi:MAG: hypothetical protein GF384_00630 [Elusimicrobia bacterium]|nr:hypothetical protein [Elusimicrobiota bacterium]MBD3411592.1 hypothetical protein [Elusimicrobiota bacterium]
MIENLFLIDNLSNIIGFFIVFFTVLVMVYSFSYMRGTKTSLRYYAYMLLTGIASFALVYANNLILLIILWGFLGMLLYMLIGFGVTGRTPATAKKTFIIIGGTDAIMLLGLGLVYKLSGTFSMDQISISIDSRTATAAYLCLAAGALAKAGCMPFHTWVPDTSEDAPVPVTAYLPASLDKLLGIYLLTRMSLNLFVLNDAMHVLLMSVGSITIVAGVMMALVQHDMKRLLGYHAVSQVGYMVLGIGTGNPIGIAGGLFHLINNALYKSCLFLTGGAVEKQVGTSDLEKLGGLSKVMPITFTTFLIAALAISGIPPLNGFASKWMVYQSIIATANQHRFLWVVFLIAAVFGSALTLASFMKLIHAIFLGQPSQSMQKSISRVKEAGAAMWVPSAILAALCIIFGVLIYRIPLPMIIMPGIGQNVEFIGVWGVRLAVFAVLIGLAIGYGIFMLGSKPSSRKTDTFVGGESVEEIPEMRLSGTEFYNTIKEIKILKIIFFLAENKFFDVYEVGAKLTFGFNALLRMIHNGVLPSYLSWCLLGTIILFYLLLG